MSQPRQQPTTSAASSCPRVARSRSSTSSAPGARRRRVPARRPARGPARLPRVRPRARLPGRVGGGLRDALGGRAPLPELRVDDGRHVRPGHRRPLRRAARPRHRGAGRGPQAPHAGEHGGRGRALTSPRSSRRRDPGPRTSRRYRSTTPSATSSSAARWGSGSVRQVGLRRRDHLQRLPARRLERARSRRSRRRRPRPAPGVRTAAQVERGELRDRARARGSAAA